MSGRTWGSASPDTTPKVGRNSGKLANLNVVLLLLVAGVIILIAVVGTSGRSDQTTPSAKPVATGTKAATTPKVDKSELAKRLMAEVKVAADAGTPWAMAVTKVECPDYCRVFYRETDLTRAEIEVPARYLFLVTKPEELDTIVVQDASGRDHNVYRAKLLPAGR